MYTEEGKGNDVSAVGVAHETHEPAKWTVKWEVKKFEADIDEYRARLGKAEGERLFGLEQTPYEVIEKEGNLLMNGGVSVLWQALIGNGTATADQTLTYFNNARAAIGVGDSNTAAAATQTDLQAATNKLRVAMDATYPTHTDGTTSPAQTITFRSSFSSGQANWVWNEWGVFNSATAATGRMLNRKVESLGTKTTGTWTLTVTITVS